MALEGSIKDFSLADIFQLIGIQRKTGVLTLRRKDEEVKVSFLNGMVVNADSRSKRLDDLLGSVLAKTGKLSPEDLKKGLKIQKETLKKLGHVLLEEHLVRSEDLREALGIQITQIIYRLFRWKDGDYHFEQDVAVDYDKEHFTPMSAESILMEGMRMIDEWPIIERKISSFAMVFEPVALEGGAAVVVDDGSHAEASGGADQGDDFDIIFGGEKTKPAGPDATGQIRLTREENTVYRQVNGKASVQEIVERTMLSEFETCRALFDLVNRNLIAPVASKGGRAKGPAKSRQVNLAGWIGKFGYGLLAAALVLAVGAQRRNPLNLLVTPPSAAPVLAPLQRALTMQRTERVAQALETFWLMHQTYPGATDALVADGLVTEEETRSLWGTPIGFEIRDDRIVVSAATGPGDDAEVFRTERPRR